MPSKIASVAFKEKREKSCTVNQELRNSFSSNITVNTTR